MIQRQVDVTLIWRWTNVDSNIVVVSVDLVPLWQLVHTVSRMEFVRLLFIYFINRHTALNLHWIYVDSMLYVLRVSFLFIRDKVILFQVIIYVVSIGLLLLIECRTVDWQSLAESLCVFVWSICPLSGTAT